MQKAASLIHQFTAERTYEAYIADVMFRSAVKRQFEIVGEALTQLTKLDATLAARITEHRQIIAFRNILIHGYAIVNHRLVWGVIVNELPTLRREVNELLNEP
jgi:uncharacterized protein with HEPN domain